MEINRNDLNRKLANHYMVFEVSGIYLQIFQKKYGLHTLAIKAR